MPRFAPLRNVDPGEVCSLPGCGAPAYHHGLFEICVDAASPNWRTACRGHADACAGECCHPPMPTRPPVRRKRKPKAQQEETCAFCHNAPEFAQSCLGTAHYTANGQPTRAPTPPLGDMTDDELLRHGRETGQPVYIMHESESLEAFLRRFDEQEEARKPTRNGIEAKEEG